MCRSALGGRRRTRGFTLIELALVVVIVGILALLAVWGVRKYIANAKTAEARNALGQIAKDAVIAYERDSVSPTVLLPGTSTAILHQLCPSSAPVPASATAIQGRKYQSSPLDWSNDVGFRCLKFTIDQPQYYQYQYTANGTGAAVGQGFTATARGDLDGDGNFSLFSLQGTIQAGMVLNVAPSIDEQNPDE